ncbi:MAG: cytochrome c [Chloroflexi bacterium]|nr:cytochrome c [Chloroflexota bacterium]
MKKTFLILSVLPLLLTACEFSLASDITPPPDAVIFGETTMAPIEAPASALDLTAGAAIYTSSCAPCHGAGGLGNGEQAAQLPFSPSAIGDPDLARAASPEDWYRVLSQGRLQRYMPPFESALSPQQRWDVLAYVYSLSWDAETLNRGAELYALNQSEIDGLLDGISPIAMKLNLVDALGLPAEDAQALAAYLQAKALGIARSERVPVEDGELSPDEEALAAFGDFRGNVIYGDGDQIPSGLEARLYGFDHTDRIVSEVTAIAADGSFVFRDIPLAAGRIFFVQVDFQGLSFFSDFLTVDGKAGTYTLEAHIYDTISDASQLAVEKIQLVFDFFQAGIVRVVESVTISNLGDRAVVPDESGQPVLHFSLPPQASNLAFEEGELDNRYVLDETGFGDTRAVIPGINSYSLLFAYELPYASSLSLPITIDLPTRVVAIFLPANEIEMENIEFQLQGSQEINGIEYSLYAAETGYFPGDEVSLSLKGAHPRGGFARDDNLLAGLAALTAAVGFAWIWLWRRPAAPPKGIEHILDEIIDLDERYERGGLAKTTYTKQRTALKARLRRELGRKNQQ